MDKIKKYNQILLAIGGTLGLLVSMKPGIILVIMMKQHTIQVFYPKKLQIAW